MDIEIPKATIRRRRMRRLALFVTSVVIIIGGMVTAIVIGGGRSVKKNQLSFGTVDVGNVENTVSASGKVVPAYEEIVVSPVNSRILEVYHQEGDEVEAGEAILRLDLLEAEAEVGKLTDELSMKRNSTEQTRLGGQTALTNLEMQIEAKRMAVDELRAEVANERRLDSIGSGTGDRVRQAELAYRTGVLELDGLVKQLANEKRSRRAELESKHLEESIHIKNLEQARRMLADAGVKAPRKATITYLNSNIGGSVAAGEKVAVLADLGHFRISGELPESEIDKLAAGAGVEIKLGSTRLRGRISHAIPQTANGMAGFMVMLDDDNDSRLRSGMKVDLNVVCGLKEGVVRIPNGSYFHGPGSYTLFVLSVDGEKLESRNIVLGDSNFDFVEVVSGLRQGERIVTTDMSSYKGVGTLKLKNN